MRKQIVFEQKSSQTCLVNIKNIFGFSINYVEDKIKRYQGKWNGKVRKFQIPLQHISDLAKQLQSIDKSYYIELIPSAVGEMLKKFASNNSKVKKQILVDDRIVKRYEYVEENVIKNIYESCRGSNAAKNYHKILILTMDCKILTWVQKLSNCKCKKLKFQHNQNDSVLREDCIWICSYESMWAKVQILSKYCFQTIILDEAENITSKINSQQQSGLALKKLLLSRHFIFPIVSKLHLNRLEILIPLLSLMLPQINLQWFSRRYRKQNISQLCFLVRSCNLTRDLTPNIKQADNHQHFFNKNMLIMSEQGIEKIKQINKKSSQIEQKKILQDPLLAKNKNQRAYLQTIFEILRSQKLETISKFMQHYCNNLNIKLAIIIETSLMYRSIQNYLCEHQINYCHYEQHHQVHQFNKNPTKMVCLIKSQYLLGINFSKPIITKDDAINQKLVNYQPQQYLCLSGVRNVMFPDLDWVFEVRRKQECIKQLFRYSHSDIIRHYFILKGSYEQKWMRSLQDTIVKVHMNLKIKQELISQEENQQSEGVQENKDPVFGFCQVNLAKVQQQYSHLKVIKGITDIDEQFDRLQFEALQQKMQKQTKKKRKQLKAKQKIQQFKLLNQSSLIKQHQNNESIVIDSQQEYEVILRKKKNRQQSKEKEQISKAKIYQPVTIPSKVLLPSKNSDEEQELQRKKVELKTKQKEYLMNQKLFAPEQIANQKNNTQLKQVDQIYLDHLKQDETEEVQIIEVRKPIPKPRIPKPKAQNMSIILRPSKLA